MTKGNGILQARMAMLVTAISPHAFSADRPSEFSLRFSSFSFQRPITAVKSIFLMLIIATWALLGLSGSTAGAEAVPDGKTAVGLVSFEEAVRIALRQSPYFTQSNLEIDVKRLDESDSRYGLIPTVSFRTRYYVNRPTTNNIAVITTGTNAPVVVNQSSVPQAYSLEFYSDTYNPFEAYFSLQARKLITRIAIFAHMQVISAGIHRLGKMFLDLETYKRLAEFQGELVELARKNLDYFENRASLGTTTSLEVRVATQDLEVAKAEQERIAASQKRTMENLKAFLGIKEGEVSPDLREVRRQVLGNFDANTVTLDQARARSWDLKINEIKKKLQEYKITLAKTRLLPEFFAGARTPDPLSISSGSSRDFFFSLGLQLPVWDGFKRYRDISRQKVILKEYNSETEGQELDLRDKWMAALEDIRSNAAAQKLAQSQEELARLKERQSEIRYHSGKEPLPVLIEGRKGVLEAQKNTAVKSLGYYEAILALRQTSGDLGYSYVDPSSWQN